MPSNLEINIDQKRRLFELMKLRKEQGANKSLNNLIVSVKVEMTAEDVAWVEKQVGELEL